MMIKTKSGSNYLFTVKDNKLYFLKGMTEGRVVEITGLNVGEPLTVKYHPLNMYSQESTSTSFLTTSPVVEILP